MKNEVIVHRRKRLIHEMWLRFVGFVKVFMSNPRAVIDGTCFNESTTIR